MDFEYSTVAQCGSTFNQSTRRDLSHFEPSTVLNDTRNGATSFKNKSSVSLRDLSMGMKATNQFTYESFVELNSVVQFVKCSPFVCASDVFGVGTKDAVRIFRLNEDEEQKKFECELLHDHHDKGRPSTLAFSRQTDVQEENKLVYAVAYDSSIVVFEYTFDDGRGEEEKISGHSDFINDIVFDPVNGTSLATVSDDCTCCIWSTKNAENKSQEIKIHLSSPGMSVKWHPSEVTKLLVAEKSGLIRIFDTNSRMAVQSFECNQYPLLACDWCPTNEVYIGCVTGSDMFIWDTSLASVPIQIIKSASNKTLTNFEFLTDDIVAYREATNATIIVRSRSDNDVLLDKAHSVGYGLSWNRASSILIAGGKSGVHVYKFSIVDAP